MLMTYMELDVDKIENNPWQPRDMTTKKFKEGVGEIALSMVYNALINPIRCRENPDKEEYYQTASGHRRLYGARTNGWEKIPVLVVDLTDAQMKLEAVVENEHQKRLVFEERLKGLENIRQDPPETLTEKEKQKLINKEYGYLATLGRLTGLTREYIGNLYKVKEFRERITEVKGTFDFDYSPAKIDATFGLASDEEQLTLLRISEEQSWEHRKMRTLRDGLKVLTPEQQKAVLEYMDIHGTSMKRSLAIIQQVKEGSQPKEMVVRDDFKKILKKFETIHKRLKGIGLNDYRPLASRWDELYTVFDSLEAEIRRLRTLGGTQQ